MELWKSGERDAAWGLWSEDCVGYPPRDWPEQGPYRGRDELRQVFDAWNAVFGAEWTSDLVILDLRDLGDGRVLLELEFAPSGAGSGVPLDQKVAQIYTVDGGQIVKAQYFMNLADGRSAAGVG